MYSILLICLLARLAIGREISDNALPSLGPNVNSKLLVIMLDGFRWDYYTKHKDKLTFLHEYFSDGVRAEWVEPTFPSSSYPAWTTISTGLHPQHHGIIGNYMYDQRLDLIFDLDDAESTKRVEWWQDAEPLWITATREQRRAFLRYWSRCDVPYQGTLPLGEISGYQPELRPAFQKTLIDTLEKLRDNDLLMVYTEYIDTSGHMFGPDSLEISLAMKELNRLFKWFIDELIDRYPEIENELNIVIVSDHGMMNTGTNDNTTYVELDKYIRRKEVINVIDSGSVVSIAPLPIHKEHILNVLSQVEGISVYRREDIPDTWHYKEHRLVQDILVVAKRGYYIKTFVPTQAELDGTTVRKAIPGSSSNPPPFRSGNHGYPGEENEEMRGIFLAKGPQFKNGEVNPPIRMEDIYQVFTRVLGIKEQPHNGTWSRVSGMFKNNSISNKKSYSINILCIISISHIFFHVVNKF